MLIIRPTEPVNNPVLESDHKAGFVRTLIDDVVNKLLQGVRSEFIIKDYMLSTTYCKISGYVFIRSKLVMLSDIS
jgi:hypothetical protein